jgi:hypothetical protein
MADSSVGSSALAAGSVLAVHMGAEAIGSAALAPQAVNTGAIGDFAVTADKIAQNSVTSDKIADNSVSAIHLQPASVTSVQIAEDAITSDGIGEAQVLEEHLADGAVTSQKIADAAVGSVQLSESAVLSANIATAAVTAPKIADGSIGTTKLASGAVTSANLQNNAVTTGKIADGAVTADKLAPGSVGSTQLQPLSDLTANAFRISGLLSNDVAISASSSNNDSSAGVATVFAGVYLAAQRNLQDVLDAAAARANVGLGDLNAPAFGGVAIAAPADVLLIPNTPNRLFIHRRPQGSGGEALIVNEDGLALSVSSDENNPVGLTVNPVDGDVTCTGALSCLSLTQRSDARMKRDISPIAPETGLSTVLNLQPVTYKWADHVRGGPDVHAGFIAQQVQDVIPHAVTGTDTLSLAYTELIAHLVGAVQAQERRLNELSCMMQNRSCAKFLPDE